MRISKRSVLAAAMLVVISMPIGLFLFWKVQQVIVRQEMLKKLGHAPLQTIEIPASAVKWYEKGREIIVEGQMFDVLSYKQIPGTDTISFTGLFDYRETVIKLKVEKLLQLENQDAENEPEFQAMWIFFFPIKEGPGFCTANFSINAAFTNYITRHFPIPDLSIPAPPPKA